MSLIPWIVFALCIAVVYSAPQLNEDDPNENDSKNIWVVLVAGSHRWIRYRHQSNVCHAYKLLRANGIPKNRIITFLYDDIAYNEQNPEPGVLRNEPGGENVYEGVPIDYSGEDVNKEVYLNVMQGHTRKVRGIGSGRVLASTKNENVFIFHTGLGNEEGTVEFPDAGEDTLMYADELLALFKRLHNRRAYKNILMVLESSHSGLMFENSEKLHGLNVMAVTAGGPDEDTWGTWCSPDFPCLAGLYTYSWLSYAENSSIHINVFDHYDNVRTSVANTGKEHPQIYGDWKIGFLKLSKFMGFPNNNILQKSNGLVKKLPKNTHLNKFDSDTIIAENENDNLQTKLNDILKLVIPNKRIRSSILKPERIVNNDVFQKKCFEDLLSLFNEKCRKNDKTKNSQEDINIFKQLCDNIVLNIQQMSAIEAINKLCV